MDQLFGHFVEPSEGVGLENLMLRFLPSSIPLQQRWRNNGLSADFLADYVTTFFPKQQEDPRSGHRQAEIKSAVSYIANELLENGMKFSAGHGNRPIVIQLQLEEERILFNLTNTVDAERADRFREFVQRLLHDDPGDLFVQHMEANTGGETASGLGLLTMINDYGARLAWKFTPSGEEDVTVTTQVHLAI